MNLKFLKHLPKIFLWLISILNNNYENKKSFEDCPPIDLIKERKVPGHLFIIGNPLSYQK